jgi:putative dehydrogenase
MNTVTRVGLIGLGAMGKGMAQLAAPRRHAPHVFDVRPETAQAFASDGGTACASAAAELGAACDVVISVVVNAAQTEAVLFGGRRRHGCASAMRPAACS